MLSLIGSLIGFAGSAVPSVLEHFTKKEDNKKQLEFMRMQVDLLEKNAEIDLTKFQARAADDEHSRLIQHDISMSDDKTIIGGLRKSVRPVITYLFFGLFAAVKISSLMVAMDSIAMDNPELNSMVQFNQAILLVWDPETQGIFAAIISFWFGSRALEKTRINN